MHTTKGKCRLVRVLRYRRRQNRVHIIISYHITELAMALLHQSSTAPYIRNTVIVIKLLGYTLKVRAKATNTAAPGTVWDIFWGSAAFLPTLTTG